MLILNIEMGYGKECINDVQVEMVPTESTLPWFFKCSLYFWST